MKNTDAIDILFKRKSGSVDAILKGYLSKFKVYRSESLFDPDFTLLKEDRCPICTNKLKHTQDGKSVYCNGKKHRKNFYMKIDKKLS